MQHRFGIDELVDRADAPHCRRDPDLIVVHRPQGMSAWPPCHYRGRLDSYSERRAIDYRQNCERLGRLASDLCVPVLVTTGLEEPPFDRDEAWPELDDLDLALPDAVHRVGLVHRTAGAAPLNLKVVNPACAEAMDYFSL